MTKRPPKQGGGKSFGGSGSRGGGAKFGGRPSGGGGGKFASDSRGGGAKSSGRDAGARGGDANFSDRNAGAKFASDSRGGSAKFGGRDAGARGDAKAGSDSRGGSAKFGGRDAGARDDAKSGSDSRGGSAKFGGRDAGARDDAKSASDSRGGGAKFGGRDAGARDDAKSGSDSRGGNAKFGGRDAGARGDDAKFASDSRGGGAKFGDRDAGAKFASDSRGGNAKFGGRDAGARGDGAKSASDSRGGGAKFGDRDAGAKFASDSRGGGAKFGDRDAGAKFASDSRGGGAKFGDRDAGAKSASDSRGGNAKFGGRDSGARGDDAKSASDSRGGDPKFSGRNAGAKSASDSRGGSAKFGGRDASARGDDATSASDSRDGSAKFGGHDAAVRGDDAKSESDSRASGAPKLGGRDAVDARGGAPKFGGSDAIDSRGGAPKFGGRGALKSADDASDNHDDAPKIAPRGARSTSRRPRVSARALSIEVLARVAATDAYLNVVLDSMLGEFPLKDPRDAGLVTELCYGATRRRLTLDGVLLRFADRGLDAIEDRVLAALRLGVYQIFFTRIPRHAAVGETIDALKYVGLERAAGFANAILRKAASLEELPKGEGDEIEKLVFETSHPAWLVKRWIRQFGPERARSMLAGDNEAPNVVVRTNTSKRTRDELLTELQEAGVECRATVFSPLGIVFESPGHVEALYGYSEGLWQVQDEAAQLVNVFGQVPASARVLDLCAAPGGKACHLAQTNEVVAVDVHANKLPKIDAEAKRLGLREKLTLVQADATQPLPESIGEFDAVVIDAPCAGLGTLRRHPELRYRREEKDIAELAHIQREILEQGANVLKPGGLLIYAVCSTDTVEGADQIEMFLRSHPDFTTEPPKGLANLPTWQGHLRTLPGPEGLDGFFAARLRKMY